MVTTLADAVLPLVRTRGDLSRWSAANAHGRQMHQAIDVLEAAIPTTNPAEVYAVTHRALSSAIKVIARADDSSGIIGDACRRLLELHPGAVAAAQVPAGKLVAWMIRFQFDGDVDYFELDPVAYAPALGKSGLATYRARLSAVEAGLEPRSAREDSWMSRHSHAWFVIEWNARRLAVLDRDIAAIIDTHARDRTVAAWLQDTAEAFEEIGELDLAIDWAKQATDFDRGHQSLKAAGYWCQLLAEHRPSALLPARLEVFRRWPSSSTAANLYQDAGPSWPSHRDEVVATLAASPRDAVLFTLLTLQEAQFAWDLAYSLGLDSDDVWERLASVYEKVEPLAVLPVLARLVDNDLTEAGAQHYRIAARRLAKMRKLATDTGEATEVDAHIVELREKHRRRPRLQQEFDRAGLPRNNLT
jgi:tetratricopeptide (TPR) repeat protein